MGGNVEKWIAQVVVEANRGGAAHESHEALTTIAEGRPLSIASDSTMTAWRWITLTNLQRLVRAGVYHLTRCPWCHQWLLATDQRRSLCGRVDCVREMKRVTRAAQRKARRDLDHGKKIAARR
jgi:hypothetical protein